MSKIIVNKKGLKRLGKFILVTIASSSLVFNVSACGENKTIDEQFAEHLLIDHENAKYGMIGSETEDCDFSLVDVGSCVIGLTDDMIERLSSEDLPTGIIVSSSATNLGEIYNELNYVKDIIWEYPVQGSIALNIDTLFNANSSDGCKKLIEAFVSKARANGIDVYLLGSEANLAKVDDLGYDEALRCDEDTVIDDELDYLMYTLNQYVCLSDDEYDYTDFNLANNFVEDYTYMVESGDNLSIIASNFGLSVNDLCIFNGLNPNDYIYPGQLITIPNQYQGVEQLEAEEPQEEIQNIKEDYYVGIDVSTHQGNINWSSVAPNINYAIIRFSYGLKVDKQFENNILGCEQNNIPHGLYLFSKADTLEKLDQELALLFENLKGHDSIALPIYIDFEADSTDSSDLRVQKLQIGTKEEKALMNSIIRTFCEKVEAAGYAAGIYMHKNNIEYLDSDIREKYAVWASGGDYYNTEMDNNSLKLGYAINNYTTGFQVSQMGIASSYGITESSYVDVDVMNKSFVNNLLKKFNLDEVQKVYTLD